MKLSEQFRRSRAFQEANAKKGTNLGRPRSCAGNRGYPMEGIVGDHCRGWQLHRNITLSDWRVATTPKPELHQEYSGQGKIL